MSNSSALPTAALIVGVSSLLAIALGASQASGDGFMALGVFALGLFAGAAIGVVGLVLAIVALQRRGPGRGRAIAGLVLSALPVLMFAFVIASARLGRPADLPLKPPTEPPQPITPVG